MENTMATRYAMVKVEIQVTLLGPRAVFRVDLFILLFQREVCIFCVFEGNFVLQKCYLIMTRLRFCEISQQQFRNNESATLLNCNLRCRDIFLSPSICSIPKGQTSLGTGVQNFGTQHVGNEFRLFTLFHLSIMVRFAVKQISGLVVIFQTIQYLASMQVIKPV